MFVFNQTISQAINNQNTLHQRIIELIVQMDHALSFAEDMNVVLNKLKSSEGVLVDLYVPRKCAATSTWLEVEQQFSQIWFNVNSRY